MKILVLPREDTNPYQALLHAELRRRGARISYLGTLTPSHTLNLLLLPLEMAVRRVAGARIVHLHWVFGFSLPGADRFPVFRRLSQAWFSVWLRAVRVLGLRLVWTAHNVLPHRPVFADDIRARRRLATSCDLVICHSYSTIAGLAALGAEPARFAVIPHGPVAPPPSADPLRRPGTGEGPRRLLFFGKVHSYKGVEDLLTAFAAIPADLPARLTVAGECDEPELRSRLTALARQAGGRVTLRLERVPDDEVTRLLADADAVVLPFRQITTSGSAMLALCHERPLVIPDLAALAELPDQAVIRYDQTVQGLSRALVRVVLADADVLGEMSAAARAYSAAITWPEIADKTLKALTLILAGKPRASAGGRPAEIT